MIGIDTSFIIDLCWTESPRHSKAVELFRNIVGKSSEKILIGYDVITEFLHVITDQKRFGNSVSMKDAINIIDELSEMENIQIVYPDEKSLGRMIVWMSCFNLGRKRIHDTSLAACYTNAGAGTFITANPKDFEIFDVFHLIDYSV